MDEIFRWEYKYNHFKDDPKYKSKPIKVPERWKVLYGLPDEMNVVVDYLADNYYVNCVTCCTLPGLHCNILQEIPERNLIHDNEEDAFKEASRLEREIEILIEEDKNRVFEMSVMKKKAPMYMIRETKVENHYTLIAGKIRENGEIDNRGGSLEKLPKLNYRILEMTPFSYSRFFYPYGGPIGAIRFNIEEISPIIFEIEKELSSRYMSDDGYFINAFHLGNWTGLRKGRDSDYFEVPISFYKVQVDVNNPIKPDSFIY